MNCQSADVVEVVRCKDCFYYSKSKLNNCILMCERRESTDYCSRGVRKKSKENCKD